MKRFLRLLRRWTLIAVLLALLITVGLYLYRFFFSYTYDATLDDVDLSAGEKVDHSITNIALFGVDTRDYGDMGTRSDTMMILTVDNTRGKIKLTSLMRDSRVPIEGYGRDKLNHAYSYGGPELAIRTINQNFGTDITEYIEVDFAQMKVLIDLVGGVWVDVSEAERKEANKFIREYCKERGAPNQPIAEAGYQHLQGVQALCYARIRKGGTGDDWGRVNRQGVVLEAMFAQVKTLSAPELISLMQEMLPYTTTSLSVPELVPLLMGALQDGVPSIEHNRLPVDGAWEYDSSGSYILYDLDEAAYTLHEYIYNDTAPGAKPYHDYMGTGGASSPSSDTSGEEEPLPPSDTDYTYYMGRSSDLNEYIAAD